MPLGVLAGLVPFFACTKLKGWLKYDDALDTFGVHAVGGTLGALLSGFLANASVNGNRSTNLKDIAAAISPSAMRPKPKSSLPRLSSAACMSLSNNGSRPRV